MALRELITEHGHAHEVEVFVGDGCWLVFVVRGVRSRRPRPRLNHLVIKVLDPVTYTYTEIHSKYSVLNYTKK